MLPHITRKLVSFRVPPHYEYKYEYPQPRERELILDTRYLDYKSTNSSIDYMFDLKEYKSSVFVGDKEKLVNLDIKWIGSFRFLKSVFRANMVNTQTLTYLNKLLDNPNSCEDAFEDALEKLSKLDKLKTMTPDKLFSFGSLTGMKALRPDEKAESELMYRKTLISNSLVNLKREAFSINPPPLTAMYLKKISDENAESDLVENYLPLLIATNPRLSIDVLRLEATQDAAYAFNGFGFGNFEDAARAILKDFVQMKVDRNILISKKRMSWSLGYKIFENILKDDQTRILYYQKALRSNLSNLSNLGGLKGATIKLSSLGLGVDIPFGPNFKKAYAEHRSGVAKFDTYFIQPVEDIEEWDDSALPNSDFFRSPFEEKYQIPGSNQELYFESSWLFAAHICNAISLFCGLDPCFYFISITGSGYSSSYQISLASDSVYVDSNANGFRMPTEAEWEALASEHASEIDWKPNTLLEWCLDSEESRKKGFSDVSSLYTTRIVKGGSYLTPKRKTKITEWSSLPQNAKGLPYMAFRLVRNIPDQNL